MTRTASIFELTAPYNNKYQGADPRWLFVCSAGLLRSPTAANIAIAEYGYNCRSCGTSEYALIPLSVNLLEWAQKIIFMNEANLDDAIRAFRGIPLGDYYIEQLRVKSVVWEIEDDYDYMEDTLKEIVRDKLIKA